MALSETRFAEASKVYRALVSAPRLIRAAFFGGSNIDLTFANLSIPRSVLSTSRQVLSLCDETNITATVPTLSSPSIDYIAHSPDGLWEVHFIHEPGKGRFLEVWFDGAKIGEVAVGDLHGQWFFDVATGIPNFYAHDDKLVYLANCPDSAVGQADYLPSFGEGYRDLTLPAIVALHLRDLSLSILLTSPVTVAGNEVYLVSPAIVEWTNSRIRLASVGWRRLGDGSQLGMAWCTNRPSSLYILDVALPSRAVSVSPVGQPDESARSPRVHASGRIVYLSNSTSAPHDSCARLCITDGKTAETHVLVAEVDTPAPRQFPGIFAHQLPTQPFLRVGSDDYIAMTSAWGCREACVLVNMHTGQVTDLVSLFGEKEWDPRASWEVLCTNGSTTVLLAKSTPLSPPTLVAVTFSPGLSVKTAKVVKKPWVPPRVPWALSKLDFVIHAVPAHDPMEILTITPCALSKLSAAAWPVILFPHGGPHSHDSTVFQALRVALALGGYVVVHPNYYGSTGYGQGYINRLLPPALSVQDVETTMAALSTVAALGLKWAKGKRFLVGSSHGGYIAGWASGRYPDKLDAVVMMNPTIHYPSMIDNTDIPDVIATSSGVPYPPENPPVALTPDMYAKAYACSPISVVDKVRTPTLLLLGADDGRVSPQQGRMWYRGLKKNGVDVEMKIYPGERHVLMSTVPGILGAFEETVQWLDRYTDWTT